MSTQLKYVVEQLNKDPFRRNYNLISFDALEPLQLLQVLNDVLSEINPQHKLDIREETPDATAMRMLAELKVLKYKPSVEPATFRQGLVAGNKPVVYSILEWLFQKMPELKKRAYLARFLVKIEVPGEILQEEAVMDTYTQYEALVDGFMELHRTSETLKTSGFSTTEIKKDISQMEDEKDQLTKRIERLKKKVETVPNYEHMMSIARNFRKEQEREASLAQQRQEQKNQLHHAEQRLQRMKQQLKDLKQSTVGVSAEDLVKKLDEENKVNAYMCEEKLPKDLENLRKACQDLERVVNEPAMGQGDLEEIQNQIKAVNSEVNGLIEKRMMSNDPKDDKLSLFRQQASIIARKKEGRADALREAKEELIQAKQELAEKRESAKNLEGEEVLKGDEFKRYVNKLRGKSTDYKRKRQELAELRAELGVLSRTEEVLKQRDEQIQHRLSKLEAKKGVAGYHDTQEELEKVSTIKSELDDVKGRTLEDMSQLVQKLNTSIASKKANLAPIIKELRPLRQQAQEMQVVYDDKKTAYDTKAAGLESNRSKLEQEVRAYREECSQEESRYHYLHCMLQIVEMQNQRVASEMKAYTSADQMEKKKAFRDQYTRKLQEQENLGKSLREKQKAVKESHGPSMKQMKMWGDFQLLMECKKRCFLSQRQDQDAGRIVRDEAANEERLVL
ncbi:intraflagellar transport protein 81 homolog [Lytechinus variegatus]|uniref:intraflagellar transport protein 81 homolog n=1 Tax=Lytechinus variegatus TaxID=7654 RepID=UPI001BB1348D|nr:intraflagellar transport protein 81 homolog [Lytechinus variegatus]